MQTDNRKPVYAKYSFSSYGRSGVGGVTLVFEDGLPKCLRFDDLHNECRIVSPAIVSQYERGQFVDDNQGSGTPLVERCANIN